jgi:hypothetical protein
MLFGRYQSDSGGAMLKQKVNFGLQGQVSDVDRMDCGGSCRYGMRIGAADHTATIQAIGGRGQCRSAVPVFTQEQRAFIASLAGRQNERSPTGMDLRQCDCQRKKQTKHLSPSMLVLPGLLRYGSGVPVDSAHLTQLDRSWLNEQLGMTLTVFSEFDHRRWKLKELILQAV